MSNIHYQSLKIFFTYFFLRPVSCIEFVVFILNYIFSIFYSSIVILSSVFLLSIYYILLPDNSVLLYIQMYPKCYDLNSFLFSSVVLAVAKVFCFSNVGVFLSKAGSCSV